MQARDGVRSPTFDFATPDLSTPADSGTHTPTAASAAHPSADWPERLLRDKLREKLAGFEGLRTEGLRDSGQSLRNGSDESGPVVRLGSAETASVMEASVEGSVHRANSVDGRRGGMDCSGAGGEVAVVEICALKSSQVASIPDGVS